MKKLVTFFLFCAVVLALLAGAKLCRDTFAWESDGQGSAVVHSFGEPDKAVLQEMNQAAEIFPQFVEETYKVKLNRRIDVWVSADTAGYEKLLTERLDEEAATARQKAQFTDGQSLGSKKFIAIDGSTKKLKNSSDRFSTMGHELFHQLQYELSDGHSGYKKSLFWLEEGTADYAGALLCERLGGRSVEKWYLDDLFTLLNSKAVAQVSQLQHTTEEERMQFMTEKVKHYTMSDVMTYYLLKHYGGAQPQQKIAAYYKALAKEEAEKAFVHTFGIELQDYLQEFSHWWQEQLSAPAQIEVTVREGVRPETVRQFEQQMELTRKWLQNHWGKDLRGHYRLVMVSSPEDFAAAMQEYAHASEVEALKSSGSVWAEDNSTLFVNAAKVEELRQAEFVSGTMLTRLFMIQQMGNGDGGMAWLLRGGSYVVGVGRLIDSGKGTLPAYQRAWRKDLRQNAQLPAVDKLMTNEALTEAANQYGSEPLSRICEYATAELVQRYGWEGLYRWQAATRQSGDGKQAFSQVFGLTVADFAAQVHMMIY